MSIKLDDIIDQIDYFDPEEDLITCYDRKKDEIVSVNSDDFDLIEDGDETIDSLPDWEKEDYHLYQEIQNDYSDRFVSLPTEWDLDESRVIYHYCFQLKDQNKADDLLNAFNGNHRYRKFRHALAINNLRESYYAYKYQAMKKLAIEWCKENHIAYQ